jgi:hypothetical protein
MRKTWIVLFLLVFLVAACSPGQSPEQVQAQIETAVAQTVVAQNQIQESVAMTVAAQSAQSNPLVESTPTPTNTLVSFPTLTPFVSTVTPFVVKPSSGGGGGGGAYVAEYSCDVIHQRPRDGEAFYSPGDKFDIKWTILNTGTKTWPAGVDVKYWSGPNFTTTGLTVVQIPVALKPKEQFDIGPFDAKAPMEKGHYVMTWVVEGKLCWPYTALDVH